MIKSKLLALPIPSLPKSRKDAIFRAQSVQYIIRSALSPDQSILIVAFYDRQASVNGFSLPCAVLYQGKEQYTTQVIMHGTPTWRDSKLSCALKLDLRYETVCKTAADERRIVSFIKKCGYEGRNQTYITNLNVPKLIVDYQSEILGRRLAARKKRLADGVDQKMLEVPKLPKSFDAWIDRWPLLRSRYGYYRRFKQTAAKCFCTHCKGEFILQKSPKVPLPLHNEKGRCPLCRSEIVFKARGRTTKLSDQEYIAILQRTKKGEMLLRFFCLTRSFWSHYQTPKTTFDEMARLFLSTDGQILSQYKHGWSAKTGRIGWYQTKDCLTGDPKQIKFIVRTGMYAEGWNIWFRPSYLYHYNLHAVLTRLNLSYDIKQMVRGQSIDITSCILQSFVYPFAPSLHRIGLSQVCEDLLNNYLAPISGVTSGPLHARLGVSKEFLTFVRQEGLGMEAINLMASLNTPPKTEDFIWFYRQGIKSEQLRFLHGFTSYHKIKTYVSKQIAKYNVGYLGHNETKEHHVAVLWKDYLGMCEKLGYDRSQKSVLFPKNVRDEHDKLVQLVRVSYNLQVDTAIQKCYPALKEAYQYQDQGYLIRPPRNFDEFVQEGASLVHCVCTNGYYNGHIQGNRLIFFIRNTNTPETPYFTLEYDTTTQSSQQIRGYRDKSAPDDVKQFVEQWLHQKCRTGKQHAA